MILKSFSSCPDAADAWAAKSTNILDLLCGTNREICRISLRLYKRREKDWPRSAVSAWDGCSLLFPSCTLLSKRSNTGSANTASLYGGETDLSCLLALIAISDGILTTSLGP